MQLKNELGVTLIEQQQVFAEVKPIEISTILAEILKENVPLARAINTEKARSELIIAMILVDKHDFRIIKTFQTL